MKINKKISVTFDNRDILEVDLTVVNVVQFIRNAFKIIEKDGCVVSRIIISDKVWEIFRDECRRYDQLMMMEDGNYIWGANVEVIPDCPKIIFLSGDYIAPAEELIKSGELS